MNVAVVGPREGADLQQVSTTLRAWWEVGEHFVLVSGGARGVDSTAETTWLELGGEVLSYRVRELKKHEEYCVEEWHLGIEQPTLRRVIEYPTAADYISGLWMRTFCVVEHADRVCAFYGDNPYEHHYGTEFTVELASNDVNQIPTYILRKGETEWQHAKSRPGS